MNIQILLTSLSGLMLLSCATENTSNTSTQSKLMSNINYEKVIKKPYDNVAVEAEYISVDSEKDSLYKLKKGGHIYVPANAFVHLNGEAVKGDVEMGEI